MHDIYIYSLLKYYSCVLFDSRDSWWKSMNTMLPGLAMMSIIDYIIWDSLKLMLSALL